MQTAKEIRSFLQTQQNLPKKEILQRFFKTGKGEYGYGDVFLGLTVPQTRAFAKSFQHIPLAEVESLLRSPEHECRLCALEILIFKYKTKDEALRQAIFDLYLRQTEHVNNWDLVDLSAPKLVAPHLPSGERDILYKLAESSNMWERRISVVATLAYVRKNDLEDAVRLCSFHIEDPHDLMHKAVGWVLREIGKKDMSRLRDFLHEHKAKIARTTLRYAIEKMEKEERTYFMTLNQK